MEEQFMIKNISTPRTSKSSKKVQVLSPRGSRGLKIRDKYVGSKYSLKYPNCKIDCTTSEKDEIIKYMSSLPCYLQHPQKYGSQNKALNFGVLDWSLLEDWKHNQAKAAGRRSSSKTKLPSASDPSAHFTDSRISSAEQRSETLGTGPCESLSSSRAKHVKVSAENHTKICYSKVQTERSQGRDNRNQEMDQTLGSMGLDSQNMKMKFWYSENSLKRQSFPVSKEFCASQIKHYDFLSSPEEPETQDVFSCFRELPRVPSVLNRPSRVSKDDYLVNFSNDCSLTSSAAHARMAADVRGTSLPSTSHSPRTSSADPHHKIQHSHVLRQDLKGSRESESALGLLSETRRKVSSHRRETQPKPTCINTYTENNSMPSDFSASNKHVDPLHGQVGHNKVKEQANAADPSAIDVSSLLIDTTSRSLGFREGIVTRPSCSGFVMPKSDSVKLDVPTNEDDGSSTDQIKTDCKRQSGPLWRMLTPLVKSRARNYVQSSSQQKHEAASICKSLLPEISLAAHEGCKILCEKLSTVGDETTEKTSALLGQQSANPADNLVDKEPIFLAQHALLQIISKNGIPSFLFSFNNHSDSFAAIERKISINGKKTLHWMYTFYAVTGIKKRTGWIKQAKNEDKHWRVSSVVGQMEASCFLFPHLARGGISESSLIIEYVLSGVRNRDPSSPGKSDCKSHVGDPMLEINSCNELAAVIIKTTSGPVKIGAKQDGDNDNEGTFFTEKSACDCYSNLDDNLSKQENQSCDSVKVILPSGLHGVPVNEIGMPSCLMDRWRSGGSCDCGGWDEGCSLTILDNQVPQSRRSLSFSQALVDANVSQQVDLFVQGAQGVAPALRFAAAHHGLYSIDFDASISSLQAFSVSIAILHSRSHAITSGMCTKILLESLLATQEGRFHMPNRFQGTGSLKSILDPPLSPVGRA